MITQQTIPLRQLEIFLAVARREHVTEAAKDVHLSQSAVSTALAELADRLGGPLLERVWGAQRFIIFYFVTGIGAGLLFSGIDYYENTQLQGAVQIYTQYPTPDGLVDFMSKHAKGYYQPMLEFLNKFEEKKSISGEKC